MGVVNRAVGYIRVSDESQADQDRASLPEQERAIREYCRGKGHHLLKVFSDIGKRWDVNRAGFKQMIAWGQENPRPFDIIVVWRADRIVGSASTVAALEPMLDRLGVGFFLSGLIHEFVPSERVERHLGRKGQYFNKIILKYNEELDYHRSPFFL